MSDPTLYGFMKDVAPWLAPLLGWVLGYSQKGGANQTKLDAVCAAQEKTSAVVGTNVLTLTAHQTLLDGHVKAMDEVRGELRENNRLLGVLVAKADIKDTQTYRTVR